MRFSDTRAHLTASIVRRTPPAIKRWVHRHRGIARVARRFFAGLVSSKGSIAIANGPLAGVRLAASEHVTHAHIAGLYEEETLAVIHALVKPGFVCYDLGASIGYLSILMARNAGPTGHVVCFEPAPHAAAEIHRNMAANDFTNYSVVSEPVADAIEPVEFAITDVAYGSALSRGDPRWPVLKMTSTTLDAFIASHPERRVPDFVKIDVEGAEDRVLAGAGNLLAARATTFCVEIHTDEDARQVREIFTNAGYRMTTLEGRPIDWERHFVAGEVQIIARPAER